MIRFRNGKYKIVKILPRSHYALNFIFSKIRERPEMFNGTVQMISTENADEMIKQIKELTDNSTQAKSLLAAYHFEDNEIGVPIELGITVTILRYSNICCTIKMKRSMQDYQYMKMKPTKSMCPA